MRKGLSKSARAVRGVVSTRAAMCGSVVVAAVAYVMVGTPSYADAVDTGFSNAQTTLLGYLGDAIGLVLAIAVLAVGIRMLVRWVKRAAAT